MKTSTQITIAFGLMCFSIGVFGVLITMAVMS